MISRRSRKLLPRHSLSLLALFASLLMVGTMVAGASSGQGTTTSTLAQTPTPIATLVPDTDVHIRHERNLAEYESVVQDGSDLVQSSAAALGSTRGGLHITIDDARAVYGNRALGSLDRATAYRFRHYVDPNGLSMPDHSEITLAELQSGSLSARGSSKVVTRLQYAASCYRLYVRYVDDNGTWRSLPTAFISDSGHYIEVLVEFASGPSANDGRITYWIDDLAIGRHESLDLYDKFRRPDHLRLGAPWVSDPTIRGALYVDEFVLREGAEYIGPEDTQPVLGGSTPGPTQGPTTSATPRAIRTLAPPYMAGH
jgi:hypothetical protein